MSVPAALGATAATLGIATIAYQSATKAHDILESFIQAPDLIRETQQDVKTMKLVLEEFQGILERTSGTDLYEVVSRCTVYAEPILESCAATCEVLSAELNKTLSNSDKTHMSSRDRIKYCLNERKIEDLRTKIGRYQPTIEIVLGLASIQSNVVQMPLLSSLKERVDRLGQQTSIELRRVTETQNRIGQENVEAMTRNFEGLREELTNCLRVCENVRNALTMVPGIKVTQVRLYDQSLHFVGKIGNVVESMTPILVDNLVSKDRAKSVIGNVDGEFAFNFFNIRLG